MKSSELSIFSKSIDRYDAHGMFAFTSSSSSSSAENPLRLSCISSAECDVNFNRFPFSMHETHTSSAACRRTCVINLWLENFKVFQFFLSLSLDIPHSFNYHHTTFHLSRSTCRRVKWLGKEVKTLYFSAKNLFQLALIEQSYDAYKKRVLTYSWRDVVGLSRYNE